MMATDASSKQTATTVFAVRKPLAPESLVRALRAEAGVIVGRPAALRRTYLDTFDWRVWRAGGRLLVEATRDRQTLRWNPPAAPSVTAPFAGLPRFAAGLPDGAIRRDLAPVLEMRALMPVGQLAVRRRLVRVLDDARKTVVRVWWEETTPAGSGTAASRPAVLLRLDLLTGYERAAARVHQALLGLPGIAPAADVELEEAAAACGRRPGDYSSKLDLRLDGDVPAAEAARAVLQQLLATLSANVGGVVADIDTEFLHDLRVAVRRSRAALGQLKGVLDAAAVAPHAEELRWLGGATGPCRDLDVFLLDIEAYRGALAADVAAALQPLADRLQRMRSAAQAQLASDLRSHRFSRLIERWGAFLATDSLGDGAPDGARPVREVAAERIRRAYRRFLKHAQRLGPHPPAAGMHRLRIDAKKLRYLVEFFASTLESARTGALVRQLKSIQDTLGTYHDLHVQQLRLVEIGRAMLAEDEAPADALLAMGRLSALLEGRQEEHHRAFAARFDAFAARDVRAAVAELGGGEGEVP